MAVKGGKSQEIQESLCETRSDPKFSGLESGNIISNNE